MKPTALLLAASLAANAAMVGALVFKPTLAPPAFRDFFSGAKSRPADVRPARATAASPAPAETGHVWSKLRTDNLKAMIAQLRDAGFPIWAIRALVKTQVDADYNARMRELMAPDPNLPFWKSPAGAGALGGVVIIGGGQILSAGSERMTEYTRLARERAKVMKDLLGDFAMRDDGDLSTGERRRFGNLDRAKIDAIARIDEDYGEMNSQIRAAMNGVTLPEDREKMALLERERQADIAALLTPQEKEDYDLRNSTVTMRIRQQLTAFKATEEEFRAIYRIQQQFSDTLYPTLANSISVTLPGVSLGMVASVPTSVESRVAAQKQINDQIRAALGEPRYAEYVRSGDREYQQLSQFAERENLAPTAPIDAYNLRQKTSEEANRIVADQTLTDDAKLAAMKALAQNARGQFLATLGPAAGKSYLNMAENWLGSLERGRAVTFLENGGMSYRAVGTPTAPARAGGGGGGGVWVLPGTPVPPR